MDTDVMTRITAQVGAGVPKDQAKGFEMDAEASAFWDRVAGEIDEAKAKGLQVDIPGEWPNPDPDDAQPAAAQEPTAAPAPTPTPGTTAPTGP